MIDNNYYIDNLKFSKPQQLIEQIINNTNKLHTIEDNLRFKLIKNGNINNLMILILARIMYGRYYNSIRKNNGRLDERHIKAQLITVCSVAIFINRINDKNTEIFKILFNLIIYHVNKINESIDCLNNTQKNDYYINYLLNNLYLKNFDRLESDILKILKNNDFKIDHNLFYLNNDHQFNLSDIEHFMI